MPKARVWRLSRERNLTLAELLASGLSVPGRSEPRVTLQFEAGEPHPSYEGSGWNEVKVRETKSGVESVLLYEPEEGGRISGVLRLRPLGKQDFEQRRKQ